jgi:hypothetical protein
MSNLISYYVMSATLMVIFSACQRETFHPEAIDQDYLTLGKGGGMAAQVDTYYVLADGRVYRHANFAKTYDELGRLSQTARVRTFERAATLADSVAGYREPGNLYYFLNIHTRDTTQSYTWGSTDFRSPEVVTDFYKNTQQLIQNLP